MLFAIIVLLMQRRYRHDAVIPIAFIIGLSVFHLIAMSNGLSTSEMADQGWLLGTFTSQELWDPYLALKFQNANWWVITRQSLTMLTLLPTALISMLFNSSGIELATRKPINFNRELAASGFANMLASFGGGIMGYHSASLSALSHKMGVHNRFVGILAAAVFGVTIYYGAGLLSLIPKLLIGGLLIYLGLSFLVRWVFESRSLISRMEYLILLVILGVIVSFGLLLGVFVGVLATIVLFALNYSQIDIVRSSLSGANYQSNVQRDPYHQQFLRNVGEQVMILKLQGYIFFGTAHNLQREVEKRAQDKKMPELQFVVLDFRFVSGIDSSALNSFVSMHYHAEANGYKLAFADLTANVQRQLEKSGILEDESQVSLCFPDIDYAVEWCENELLQSSELTAAIIPSFRAQIAESFPPEITVDSFMAYLDEQIVEENIQLIIKGDAPRGIYFIERGQVTIQIVLEDGEAVRLSTMGSGTVVGEIGTYLGYPASATVVTDMPCIVYYLSLDALIRMEKDDPAIAAAFHKYMVANASQRLMNMNTTLQALLE